MKDSPTSFSSVYPGTYFATASEYHVALGLFVKEAVQWVLLMYFVFDEKVKSICANYVFAKE